MDLPTLPPKPAALLELEQRHRGFREQRIEIEKQLRGIETALSRAAMGNELDEIAEQLADGTLTEIKLSDLPAERADLQRQLDVATRADQKTHQKLTRERERYNRKIVRAFRPIHKAVVQRIARAIEELVAANIAEQELRQSCPVALVNLSFPNIGTFP